MSKISVSLGGDSNEKMEVDEINAKLASGELTPSTRAWMPGMSGWKPLSDGAFFALGIKYENQDEPPPLSETDKLKDKGMEAVQEASKAISKLKEVKDVTVYLPHLKLIDKILAFFKKILTPGLLETTENWLLKLGHLSAVGATFLFLLLALVGSIKTEVWDIFLYSLLGIPAMAIAQYIAVKFMGSGKDLISRSPGKIATQGFLDALVLMSVLLGFLALGGGFYYMIKASEPMIFAVGLLLTFGSLYVAICGFNPSTVNINLGDENASVGEEALGLVSFIIKSYMRSVPLVFGLTITLSFLAMLYYTIDVITEKGYKAVAAIEGCMICFGSILFMMLLPFLTYIGFVFYYLFIDLCRTILSLDADRKPQAKSE